MNRFVSQLGGRGRRARAAVLVGIAALISGALIAPPAHAIVDVGPLDPATGFPAWYEDGNSLSLQVCSNPAFCTVAPADNFYYLADARMPATVAQTARLDLSLVAAFANGLVIPGDQQTFQRFRFEIPAGLVPGATYTLTYPFGVRTFVADIHGAIKAIETTGCPDVPCNFADAMGGPISNYLVWDPAFAPAAPVGFVGDGGTPHAVVGSPLGTNIFKVTGPRVGGLGINTIQTQLFTVQGQLANPAFFVQPGVPVFRAASGPGAGEITVSWDPPARDGGAKITGYRVYGGDAADSLAPITTLDGAARSFTEPGLTEGSVRFYMVSAINAVGESDMTTVVPVSATTFARPSEPLNLFARPGTGLLQADLTWSAPETNGGTPVTTYTIYRAQGSGAMVAIAAVQGDVLRYTDSGLLPILSYHYAVSASNLVGESGQTAPSCTRAFPWVDALDAILPCGTL